MIATDFLHVDTVLLRRVYVLVFVEHHTRRLHIAGISAHPDGAWSAQRARECAMTLGQRLEAMSFLIHDRGGQFTAYPFRPVIDQVVCGGIQGCPANASRRASSGWMPWLRAVAR